jgi:type I site-specific restriction endonuclease
MYSTLFKLSSSDLNSEAEVETRLLAKLFEDLGYPVEAISPKSKVESLWITQGVNKTLKEVDFFLHDQLGNPRIVVEAKEPNQKISSAWGQAASYALSYNANKTQSEKIKYLLISNGYITSLY